MLFVNCHLPAHKKGLQKRTLAFKRIMTHSIGLAKRPGEKSSASASAKIHPIDDESEDGTGEAVDSAGGGGLDSSPSRLTLTSRNAKNPCKVFDQLFFFGDLNFRLDSPRDMVDVWIANRDHARLLSDDQLFKLMKKEKSLADVAFLYGRATSSSSAAHDEGSESDDEVPLFEDPSPGNNFQTRISPERAGAGGDSGPATTSSRARALSEPPGRELERGGGVDNADPLKRTVAIGWDDLSEMPIRFPPTYKLEKGHKILYDLSKKRRCPSWTDRIL